VNLGNPVNRRESSREETHVDSRYSRDSRSSLPSSVLSVLSSQCDRAGYQNQAATVASGCPGSRWPLAFVGVAESLDGLPAHQDADGAGVRVRGRDVRAAVAIEVGNGEASDGRARANGGRGEGARAIVGVQRHSAGVAVGHEYIERPVAIHVSHHQARERVGSRRHQHRRVACVEATNRVAGQDGERGRVGRTVTGARHGEVSDAVAVEVACSDVARVGGDRDRRRGGEGPGATAGQQDDLRSGRQRHGKVQHTVAVGVERGHGGRGTGSAERYDLRRGEEATGTVVQHNAQGPSATVDRHEVHPTVAVEVRDQDGRRVVADGNRQLDRRAELRAVGHGERAAGAVGRDHVRGAVAVEVAYGHRARAIAGEERGVESRTTVGISEQNCDSVAGGVGSDEVRDAIGVPVDGGEGIRG